MIIYIFISKIGNTWIKSLSFSKMYNDFIIIYKLNLSILFLSTCRFNNLFKLRYIIMIKYLYSNGQFALHLCEK